MRCLRRTVLLTALIAVCVAPIANADSGPGDDQSARASRVTPATSFDGSTGPELLAEWFSQLLALPPAVHPIADSGDGCLRLGRNGRILAPVNGFNRTTIACTVEASRPVFIVATDADCSTAEEEPFHAEGAAAQAACALQQLQLLVPNVPSITVAVDGGAPVEIRDEAFVVVSPQGQTVFPDDAIFEPSAGGPATFAGAAWAAKVHGLSRGPHTIVVHYTFAGIAIDELTATFNLDAVGGHGG